jgi:ketosteroid isomerase-like protein
MHREATMSKPGKYSTFQALDPFFKIMLEGLSGLVDGEHFFDTFAEDARFESLYDFPGWPKMIRGRVGLVDALSGYGANIRLESSDGLVVYRTQDPRVVILEYAVHGKVLATGAPYDNRFISVVTMESRKIVQWRDYMDSLAAWLALNRGR